MRLKLCAGLILSAACWLTTACPAPCEIDDNEIAGIHQDGAQLITALDAFRTSENKYPAQLAELAPQYLDRVPEKIGGRSFSYSVNDKGKYNLRIASPSGGAYSGGCSYAEVEERWQKFLRTK